MNKKNPQRFLMIGFYKMQKLFQNNYVLFSLLVIFIMFCVSLAISRITYQAVVQEAKMSLQIESNRIEDTLSSTFYEIESLMIYAAKRIVKEGPYDPPTIWKYIYEILDKRLLKQNSEGNGPLFAWLDTNNRTIVNSPYGILLTSYDLSLRRYTKIGRQFPWKLHFDPPGYRIPSGKLGLNGGIGIQDEEGNFVGTLTVGFEIALFTAQIEQILANNKVEFAIFDSEKNLVMHLTKDQDFSFFENFFHLILEGDQKQKKSYEAMIEEGANVLAMAYISHLPRYPFTVITYIKEGTLKKEWIPIMTFHILEVMGIGVFCLVLLYFFWKRIYKKNRELDETKKHLEHALLLAKPSDSAKEAFLRCINNELMIPLTAIVNHVDTLLKNLNKKMDTQLVRERQIELLEEILNQALAFKNLTNPVLDFTKIEIKKVIEECVTIHSKSAFDKGILVEIHIADNLPKLYADELKIKQIFVGLLSRAIKYNSREGKIEILGSQEIKEGELYIKTVVQNDGFGLSDEMIANLSERLESIHEKIDRTEMDFASIERLVHMHKGTCTMKSQPEQGTSVTLLFPIHHSIPVEQHGFPKSKKKTILPFSYT